MRYRPIVGILSDDEARHVAEQLLHDIANAVDIDTAANIYDLFSHDGRDAMAIYVHVVPALTDALDRYKRGDRSQGTLNLVAAGKAFNHERQGLDAEAAAARHANAAEQRAAAMLPAPSPSRIAMLTDCSDLLDIPLPFGAVLLEQSDAVRRYSTTVATVMELCAAYQHRMVAKGWTYDWRCSEVNADRALLSQNWYHASQYFLRPTHPVQCVSIILESRDDSVSIQLQELFGEEMPEP